MKQLLLLVVISSLLVGCSCLSVDTGFGLDGKAVSWCKRKKRAEKLCRKHDGLKNYYYEFAECNNGVTFREEVEK